MKSARHVDLISAQKYQRDAKLLWYLAKENNLPFANSMGVFKPCLIESNQLSRSLNETGSVHYRFLFDFN